MTNSLRNDHHIPDKTLKGFLANSAQPPKDVFLGAMPDWLGPTSDGYLCFEYENSSRGFVSHVCKYIYLASQSPDIHFHVVMLGSLHHSRSHSTDFRNASVAASACRLSNLTFDFGYDDGSGDIVARFAATRAIK